MSVELLAHANAISSLSIMLNSSTLISEYQEHLEIVLIAYIYRLLTQVQEPYMFQDYNLTP